MANGTVKWFNDAKGFGFISPEDGSADVFAHFSAINSKGFRSLREGQRVSYEVTQGPKGAQALNITPLDWPRIAQPHAGNPAAWRGFSFCSPRPGIYQA